MSGSSSKNQEDSIGIGKKAPVPKKRRSKLADKVLVADGGLEMQAKKFQDPPYARENPPADEDIPPYEPENFQERGHHLVNDRNYNGGRTQPQEDETGGGEHEETPSLVSSRELSTESPKSN
uniref:Uncharacterized protein n=2 Tax=Lygus hesperus TaxID=30085 RepID=A0A146MEQ6_LYGHE